MARILVVDDNEADRLLLKTVLEGEGHTVLFSVDGEGALKIFGFHDIDVVVTDLQMPKLNGLRLIRELREQDLGAIHTLGKPIDPPKLMSAVSEAMGSRQQDLWNRGRRT